MKKRIEFGKQNRLHQFIETEPMEYKVLESIQLATVLIFNLEVNCSTQGGHYRSGGQNQSAASTG